MFTDINKHGTTIIDGMEIITYGFAAGSKYMVEGAGTILLTGSLGIGAICDGVGHILYDGMMALPKVAVCK